MDLPAIAELRRTSDGAKVIDLERADAQLLGRVTYEGFAAAWPAMEETAGDFGKKTGGAKK